MKFDTEHYVISDNPKILCFYFQFHCSSNGYTDEQRISKCKLRSALEVEGVLALLAARFLQSITLMFG